MINKPNNNNNSHGINNSNHNDDNNNYNNNKHNANNMRYKLYWIMSLGGGRGPMPAITGGGA